MINEVSKITNNPAFGHPGIEPRWTHGSKEGVGTAYSTASKIWYTLWNGVVTEIFFPTIDKPQTRDTQYLVSDGKSWFKSEKQHLKSEIEQIDCHSLGYRIVNRDPEGRFEITKEIISDPHLSCILQRTVFESDKPDGQGECPTLKERPTASLARASRLCRLATTGDAEASRASQRDLHLYLISAPHLEIGGKGNNGYAISIAGYKILVAQKEETWMAVAATIPFKKLSCGYVGQSDGWQDLADNYVMDWEFDSAEDGNIALMGELDLDCGNEFTLGMAFGNTLHKAITTLLQGLDIPYDRQKENFIAQWQRTCDKLCPLDRVSGDGGNLYHSSFSLILAHEDKSYPGALIASLSIPWGQEKTDDADYGGYHLVWPRDLYNSATALLAAGYSETPLRTLIYLATCQQKDGGFAQNFWIDGTPDRQSAQLDEVAYPILLAWKLKQESALRRFDPYPMAIAAAKYLILHCPVTPQERWEQSSGFSPATLATIIAALTCTAVWTESKGDRDTAKFIQAYADFLECHIETWTVTTGGTLVPEIPRHYIRITPADPEDTQPNEDPNSGTISIPHRHPDSPSEFRAKEIVDPSFLQLVRYGVRSPNDPLIVDSLKVVDAVLKTDTPYGAVWKRYNHDGHGQRDDGSAWDKWGTGRSWILLTGERGQYELAAGGDPRPYIEAFEGFATPTGLLPEQVWDTEDIPDAHMYLGKPTGSAMPLLWSHSEYIKLLRSTMDGQPYDYLTEVGDRYLADRSQCQLLEIWQLNRQVARVKTGYTLRIQIPESFTLQWTNDDWQTTETIAGINTCLGISYVDIEIEEEMRSPICFKFTESEQIYQIDIISSS